MVWQPEDIVLQKPAEAKKSLDDLMPDWYKEEGYDWIDEQLSLLDEDELQKAGVAIGGKQPRGAKIVGKKVEQGLYGTLQRKVDAYLKTLTGNESQQEVIDGVRQVIKQWHTGNLPLIQSSFQALFARGLAAGVVSGGGALDAGDKFVLELLNNSQFRIGDRIQLFAQEVADRYAKVVGDAFGPNQEFNLPKLVRDMNQSVPAERYKLERIARTEVGQTSGLGRFWGWNQEPDTLHTYEYFWNHAGPDGRTRPIKFEFAQWNPMGYDDAWFLWTHNHKLYKGKWIMGAINCRCTISRSPVSEEYHTNHRVGKENLFKRTMDIKFPFEE
jgi:hypothetical protein